MRNKPLRRIPLRVHEANMMIHLTDPLQLIRVPMMMWTPVHADQEYRHVHPTQAQQVQLELIHIRRFPVQE